MLLFGYPFWAMQRAHCWMMSLHMFALSRKQERKPHKDTKEIAALILDLVLAAVPLAVDMPILARWGVWLLCWVGFIVILSLWAYRVSTALRGLTSLILIVLFAVVVRPLAVDQWRQEQAARQDGDLQATQLSPGAKGAGGVQPLLQVGDTPNIFVVTPNWGDHPPIQWFYDAGLRMEWGSDGRPQFSTSVRDQFGHLVVEIEKNHWTIYPNYCADKNYTRSALEVKDSAGHVVLQVRVFLDRIQVLGEWWNTSGSGRRMWEDSSGKGYISVLSRENQHDEGLITPIFAYPSKYHWKEFTTKQR
jgi:hypothetical protein